jgi:hypothetical protein
MSEVVEIQSREFWFKVVGMLQQNWALVESTLEGGVRVLFIDDASTVFDEMAFPSDRDAAAQLERNGFAKYDDDEEAKNFIRPPQAQFRRGTHPNGAIYSSGRFWR